MQQRDEFVARELIGDVMNFIPDLRAAPFSRVTGKMTGYSLFNIDGFADVNHRSAGIMEIINTTFEREACQILLSEDWGEEWFHLNFSSTLSECNYRDRAEKLIKNFDSGSRISTCTMPVGNNNSQTFRKASQAV
jgi:hypothetical protein